MRLSVWKAMGALGMLVGIVAMASPALGSTRHVNCDVPGQTITKALGEATTIARGAAAASQCVVGVCYFPASRPA